jgi:hypothetical protein
VVKATFGKTWEVAVCEICRHHDPLIVWPVDTRLHADLTRCRPDEFNVHLRGV